MAERRRERERDRERGGREGERESTINYPRLTKHNDIQSLNMLLAHLVHPCLVSQQRVLVASDKTNVVHNEHISTLNVAQLGKAPIIKEQHRLGAKMHIK